MNVRPFHVLSAAVLTVAATAVLPAQGTPTSKAPTVTAHSTKITEEKPGMLAKATVKGDAATKTALARVPGSHVQTAELEEEDGKLVYSFDLKIAGKSGIEEVMVDATSGKVISVEHESAAKEAAEAEDRDAKVPKPVETVKNAAAAKSPPAPARKKP